MDPQILFRRYQELQAYVGWTEQHARQIRAAAGKLESRLPALVDDFYAEIEKHPDARKVIASGEEQIHRLKGTLLGWMRELVSGTYDQEYVARRWRVGLRHVEIGLDQVFTIVALSRLRLGLLTAVGDDWQGDVQECLHTRRALTTLIDLDLAIIQDAYQAAYSARQVREAEERARLAERLAAIGRMIAGLAHESGNALARIQACLEMLAPEVEDRPEALELIGRMQRAQNDLQKLFADIRSYAAPMNLQREDWNLSGIWRQAWTNLSEQHKSRQVALREQTGGLDLHFTVDAFRLEQVFRNVLDNALAACADPAAIDIVCQETKLRSHAAVCVAVRDNGPGLTPEARQRIFEPFFSTKTKGTGLGMAIARRIVEAHGGEISLGPGDGRGAEIQITLQRGQPLRFPE